MNTTAVVDRLDRRIAEKLTQAESKAVGLYAVLDRDFTDFLDMIQEKETSLECLEILRVMLTLPNKGHDQVTKDLNVLGAKSINKEIDKRLKLTRSSTT